jgi:MFS family permease
MSFLAENAALGVLATCWGATLSASALSFTVAPLVAKEFGISDALAPFTNSLFLIGMAVIASLSAFLFDSCGRRVGFASGAAVGALGGAVGVIGVLHKSALLIFVSSFFVGVAQGLAQFYRFAALERASTPSRRPIAVGFVLSGGFVAAFAGPELTPATDSLGANSVGSFGAIVVLHTLNGVLSLAVPLKRWENDNEQDAPLLPDEDADGEVLHIHAEGDSSFSNSKRSLSVASQSETPHLARQALLGLLLQPRCVVAVLVATFAQMVMVGLMSPLGLEMTAHNIPDHLITRTFELHIASMYGPGEQAPAVAIDLYI